MHRGFHGDAQSISVYLRVFPAYLCDPNVYDAVMHICSCGKAGNLNNAL